MKFTLRQIQVFDAIVTCKSTLAAARALKMSQPAVSNALLELEANLGTKLFDRWKRRMVLNEVGKSIIPKAKLILANAKELDNQLLEYPEEISGFIHLGASTTPANYILPYILSDFAQKHGSVRVAVSCRNKSTIIKQVRDFTLDIGVIAGSSTDPDLISFPWIEDELCVFCSASHPLAASKTLPVEKLLKQKWILREEGSGTRAGLLNALPANLNSNQIMIEFDSLESIKRAVGNSHALGCISLAAIRHEVESGFLKILPTPYLDLTRKYSILIHTIRKQSSLLSYFCGYCRFDKSLSLGQ